jgi:hypothetical protein
VAVPKPAHQNSAGRLLAVLNASPAGQTYLDFIPRLFDSAETSADAKRPVCLTGLVEIHNLYLEFLQDMNNPQLSDELREVILSGLINLKHSIYAHDLNAGYRAPTDAEKSLLAVAATIISKEAELEKDDIEKIRESITALRALVENADIEPQIRTVLLDLIRISENAISRFNIHGARGFKRAFKIMLGEVMDIYGMASVEGEREALKDSDAWAAIVKHLRTFDEISSRLLKYKPLLENVSQLLIAYFGKQ